MMYEYENEGLLCHLMWISFGFLQHQNCTIDDIGRGTGIKREMSERERNYINYTSLKKKYNV
jgi:hypothetical protein